MKCFIVWESAGFNGECGTQCWTLISEYGTVLDSDSECGTVLNKCSRHGTVLDSASEHDMDAVGL